MPDSHSQGVNSNGSGSSQQYRGQPAPDPVYEEEGASSASSNDDSYAVEDEEYTAAGFDGPNLGDSHASLLNNQDRDDPNYLYGLLQEALPKQGEAAVTELQRRDQAEIVWERVRRWLWANPHLSQRQAAVDVRGVGDATCLHIVCKLHNPPEDIVHALVDAALDTVQWTDNHGWLPLHHACANGASPEVIKILVDAYPAGKVTQDKQSRTPLHFYATRNSDNPAAMAMNAELLSDTGAAALSDRSGMLPIHYACAYGTHLVVLKVLAKAHPASLTAKENNGRTPMHLAMVNAHRDESPNVMRFLLGHSDAVRTIDTRDHDGYLPLHLLALGLKGYRADDPDKRTNVSECLSMYLAAEPKAAADFLTAIQDLPDWLRDTAVVSKHVRNVLNLKIVQRFPTSILMLDGIMLIMLIVCFTLTTRNHIDMRFQPDSHHDTTSGALVMVFVGVSYFLTREVVQFASLVSIGSVSSWWTDLANYLDITVIVLVMYFGILMADSNAGGNISDTTFRTGVAFTQGTLWVAIIVYLKSTLVDFAVFVGKSLKRRLSSASWPILTQYLQAVFFMWCRGSWPF
jgi:ankyrin repeat protein